MFAPETFRASARAERDAGYGTRLKRRSDSTSGIVCERPAFIERGNRGAEHIGDADTFDVDYGQLLERVCGKWVVSPRGFAKGWNPASQASRHENRVQVAPCVA